MESGQSDETAASPSAHSTPRTPVVRKLLDLIASPSFNKRLSWAEVLLRAAEASVPKLTIPETMLTLGEGQGVFLYTDADGVVRVRSGER